MRKIFDYFMIFAAYILQYVYAGVALWQLWLALPFVSGYNWHTSLVYVSRAILMYLGGCFVGNECEELQAMFLVKYPEEQEEE
jgi:hypothetical protein